MDNEEIRELKAALRKANKRIADLEAEIEDMSRRLNDYYDGVKSRSGVRKKAIYVRDFLCMLDMRDQGVIPSGISREMGISNAVITQFLKREYPGRAAQQAWAEYDSRK